MTVRDGQGVYLGCLEVAQDVTRLRRLGSGYVPRYAEAPPEDA